MAGKETPTISLDRYRLLLAVAEAANSQLDLDGVLFAVQRALSPFVAVDGIGVIVIEGTRVRLRSLHLAGGPPRREAGAAARALAEAGGDAGVASDGIPLKGTGTEFVGRTGKAYVCHDVQESRVFTEDENLARVGVRSYVRTPLFARGRLIGSLTFGRLQAGAFTALEAEILEEITGPIAGAVANSLAFSEIARLRDRLAQENLVLQEEIDRTAMFEEIVGASAALRRVLARAEKVAPTDSTVLITGETGTGKELLARAIHRRSPRAGRALIAVNLAALPEALVASELFGHEKGAFTGALARRVGRFELAHGGTIFLDEIAELPAEMQVALLRVLQEGEFERLGGSQTIRTDARVIAATNRDIGAAVAAGAFREDLYYRLNVFPIELPPLRERREDISILVEYFVSRHAARLNRPIRRVPREAMERLVAYDWPGNVRELENVVERAVILTEGDLLDLRDVALGGPRGAVSLPGTIGEQERRMIEAALAQSRGRVSGPRGAAARLKLPATTLESKIKKLGIDKFRFRGPGFDEIS